MLTEDGEEYQFIIHHEHTPLPPLQQQLPQPREAPQGGRILKYPTFLGIHLVDILILKSKCLSNTFTYHS